MKQKITLGILTALFFAGSTALTSCNKDMDDYIKKPYSVTDADRVRYAEKVLGVKIDTQQDWLLTLQNSVKITADADLEDISKVEVLDGSPFVDEANVLASAQVSKGSEKTLTFRANAIKDLLYVACYSADGRQCMARPFLPGVDKAVSFRDIPTTSNKAPRRAAKSNRATTGPMDPDTENFYLNDYPSFWRTVQKLLPEGEDNRSVIGSQDYTNTIQMRENPYMLYDLPLVFVGGDNQTDIHILYTWYPADGDPYQESFLIKDNYDGTGTVAEQVGVKDWKVKGHYLQCRQGDLELDRLFTPGDKLVLQLAKGEELMSDADKRIKIFMLNGYVLVACEDGDDWDFNDRVFWMPYGSERIGKATSVPFPPTPTQPQIWTYAWEDNTMEENDVCDYDMNDCVIEVQEKADDPSKLEITLVALGATRDLWLGFEDKNGRSYRDYQAVFDKELHEVMGVPAGTMVNTGNHTSEVPAKTIIVDKPSNFDFHTCSFVLGAKVKENMRGVYDNDYYMLHISTAGSDPHGIIIPGKWQWPTEKTCIKNAYKDFITWASDRTKSRNWYTRPEADKVVKR